MHAQLLAQQVEVSAADWRKMMGMAEPKLELKKVASSRLGVLTSGDAYVITCQTGYLVVVEGDSSDDEAVARAAVSPAAAAAVAARSSSSSQSAAKSVAAAALAAGSAAVKTEVIMETVLYLWLGQDYPLRDELRSKVSSAILYYLQHFLITVIAAVLVAQVIGTQWSLLQVLHVAP
jgi:positive regulator of sigma E activity